MDLITAWFLAWGWKVAAIIVITAAAHIVVVRGVPIAVRRTIGQRMRNKPRVEIEKRADTIIHVVDGLVGVILWTLALLTVLKLFIEDITAYLAGLGIVGIAVGFGAQYLVRDLIAGYFVFSENQYNVGDVIKVGDAGGVVEEMSLRRTVLRDIDGARHIVPNGEIRILSNLTQEWSRVNLSIRVAFSEDVDKVMALMKQTWEEMADDPKWAPLILARTPSILRVSKFEDMGVSLQLVGETHPIKQWEVAGEYLRRIKSVFEREHVKVPQVPSIFTT